MALSRDVSEDLLAFLRALAEDALAGRGWTRRAVRGWRFTDELTSRFPFAVDHMRVLQRRGFAVREDVLDCGRSTALYLNRVTQAGEDYLAAREGREPRVVSAAAEERSPEDLETLYLPTDAWAALRVLAALPDTEQWLPGTRIIEAIGRTFYHEEGEFLAARGLVERRRPEAPSRPNESMLYRATPLGRGAAERDASTSETRVQIRVPGLLPRVPAVRPTGRGSISGG
jgi:hypothetical protein